MVNRRQPQHLTTRDCLAAIFILNDTTTQTHELMDRFDRKGLEAVVFCIATGARSIHLDFSFYRVWTPSPRYHFCLPLTLRSISRFGRG